MGQQCIKPQNDQAPETKVMGTPISYADKNDQQIVENQHQSRYASKLQEDMIGRFSVEQKSTNLEVNVEQKENNSDQLIASLHSSQRDSSESNNTTQIIMLESTTSGQTSYNSGKTHMNTTQLILMDSQSGKLSEGPENMIRLDQSEDNS